MREIHTLLKSSRTLANISKIIKNYVGKSHDNYAMSDKRYGWFSSFYQLTQSLALLI
jgi:hypothetical protein